jgi:outer membrane immunogenic protein
MGYNWQFNNIVLGLETDLSAAGFRDSRLYNANPAFSNNTRINWVGTTRARAGLAFDKALLYVTGGLAYGGVSIGAAPGPIGVTTSRTRLGFALGTGVEYAFAPNWTAKLEYMYYNFGSSTYTTSVVAEFIRATPQVHTVKLGVNYLFSTGPSAVIARY